MILDFFSLAFTNLKQRRLRSWLTMIGIFIGIAAVVALISLGQGLQVAINDQFSLIGADKLFITAKGRGFGVHGGTDAGLLQKRDLDVIEKVKGVHSTAGRVFNLARVEFNDKVHNHFLVSVPDNIEGLNLLKEIELLSIDKGRFLKIDDKNKAVVGSRYLEKGDFGKAVSLGHNLVINGEQFKVIGILKKTGDPFFDSGILISEGDIRRLVNDEENLNAIMVKVSKGFEPAKVGEDIEKAMRRDKRQKIGKEDFNVETPDQIMQSFNTVLNVVQAVLIGIAAISLLVGGIGIMNTMYTSVIERTKEIGVLKAIGATKKNILTLFVIESGLLGLFGGGIGVAIGIGISKAVEIVATHAFGSPLIRAEITVSLVLSALLFSFIIGTLSGLMPAKKAAELQPVDALRYE